MASQQTAPRADRHLVGQRETRREIERLLDDAEQGHGAFLVLSGEDGIGKSALIRFAAELAEARGFRVALSRAQPADFPRPFAAVQAILEPLRAELPAPPKEAGAPTPFSLLMAPIDAGRALAETSEAPAREELTPEAENRRLLEALADVPRRLDQRQFLLLDRLAENLAELSRDRPIFLALDDLPFVDEASLEFFGQLRRRLARCRVAFVASTWPLSRVPEPVRRFLENREVGVTTRWHDLRGLEPDEIQEYLAAAHPGSSPSGEEAARLFQQTRGNPSLLEQLARGYRPGPSAWGESGPWRLEDAHRSRYQSLPEPVQKLLCYAAVIGKEFSFSMLTEALNQESERVSSALDGLVVQGLIRETRPEVFEFAREPLRQEIYAGLTESRRRILHHKVAEAIENSGWTAGNAVFELERHFYLARDWARALEYAKRAAQLASSAYAYRDARLHLERAIECARHLPARDEVAEFQLETELGRTYVATGEPRAAIKVLQTLVERARTSTHLQSELPIAALWLAQAHSTLWEHPKARELALTALRLFQSQGDRTGIATAHRIIGAADWDAGRYPTAEQHQREAACVAAEAGDHHLEAHALIDLANVLLYSGPSRAEEALQLYDRAAALFREARDPASLARVHMNRSILLHNMGRKEESLAEIGTAIHFAEESGSLLYRVYTYLNEAAFRAEDGDAERVRPLVERARELNERLQDRLTDQQIAMIMGMLQEQEGALLEAHRSYRDALRVAQALDMVPDVVEMHYRIARLALKRGNPEEARAQLAEAERLHVNEVRADLVPKIDEIRRALRTG
jgi:predicted ATPase